MSVNCVSSCPLFTNARSHYSNMHVATQMARSRSAIELFCVPVDDLPDGVMDTNGNDNYVPNEDIVEEWTAIPSKNEDGTFSLRFTYQLKTEPHQPDDWVQMKTWEIESIEAQGEYEILDMKYKKDRVNLLVHYRRHPFSYPYAVNHAGEDAKHFNLQTHFSNYQPTPHWPARKLNGLILNLTKYNSAVQEANKKKKSPRRPTSAGAGGSRSAPRSVPASSRLTEGPSRQSTPSKRSREDMEKSGITEGAEASSAPKMPTPLKKGQEPDPGRATKILRDFNEYSKDCWPMGRHFTFNVDCFKCEKSPNKWVVRSREPEGVKWQINNLISNVKWDRQTVCVMPKGFTSRPTPRDWPKIENGEFWIIDGQHSLEAACSLLKNEDFQHELKQELQYWKAFVVWSDDWEKLRKISTFLNSGNKIKAFEASWAANIIAARDVWVAHGSPAKERENARHHSPNWKVRIRTCVRNLLPIPESSTLRTLVRDIF